MSTSADRMPAGIPFIVANEFAERFCYYGVNAILTVYLVNFLHFGDAQATTWQSLFKSAAYFFPVLGAIVSDVFLGKFKTIILFSLAYVAGCTTLALVGSPGGIAVGLGLMAFGTGGIKPCVSTNVGDQFTTQNQHLIERAFSYFYFSINAGSSISILLCPWLLNHYGRLPAFGISAIAMGLATLVFWLGRKRFAVVPPAGRAWLGELFSKDGLALIGRLLAIYVFVALFWALWDQSNGQTWTLQAMSDLMDKRLFGFLAGVPGGAALASLEILPAQLQVFNGLFILAMIPIFSFGVYPLMGVFFKVTPLRKIGIGLFVTASSFLVVAWIEAQIQSGRVVSLWWQVFAYVILTAGEVLVSITALEFSYKQAPLKMKSFIMSLFLLSISIGNLFTGAVNYYMVRPLPATQVETGAQTFARFADASKLVEGQKIDFAGDTGVTVTVEGKAQPLAGTWLLDGIDVASGRAQLLDAIHRQPVASEGAYKPDGAQASTYALVGPAYFLFFAEVLGAGALLYIVVAVLYREKTFVRGAEA
ncbi:MAG: hypothetical protein QM661_03045 [Solimonas sp.]